MDQNYLDKSKKFKPPQSDFASEDMLAQIQPRDPVKKKQIREWIKHRIEQVYEETNNQITNAPKGVRQLLVKTRDAKINAWKMWDTQVEFAALDEQVNQEFSKEFYGWLRGKGKEEDHQKTPWHRHRINDKEVQNYITSFAEAKIDFIQNLQRLVVKANTTGLDGIKEYYMYYKYIVKGGWEDASSAEFLYDWNKYLGWTDQSQSADGTHNDYFKIDDISEMGPLLQAQNSIVGNVTNDDNRRYKMEKGYWDMHDAYGAFWRGTSQAVSAYTQLGGSQPQDLPYLSAVFQRPPVMPLNPNPAPQVQPQGQPQNSFNFDPQPPNIFRNEYHTHNHYAPATTNQPIYDDTRRFDLLGDRLSSHIVDALRAGQERQTDEHGQFIGAVRDTLQEHMRKSNQTITKVVEEMAAATSRLADAFRQGDTASKVVAMEQVVIGADFVEAAPPGQLKEEIMAAIASAISVAQIPQGVQMEMVQAVQEHQDQVAGEVILNRMDPEKLKKYKQIKAKILSQAREIKELKTQNRESNNINANMARKERELEESITQQKETIKKAKSRYNEVAAKLTTEEGKRSDTEKKLEVATSRLTFAEENLKTRKKLHEQKIAAHKELEEKIRNQEKDLDRAIQTIREKEELLKQNKNPLQVEVNTRSNELADELKNLQKQHKQDTKAHKKSLKDLRASIADSAAALASKEAIIETLKAAVARPPDPQAVVSLPSTEVARLTELEQRIQEDAIKVQNLTQEKTQLEQERTELKLKLSEAQTTNRGDLRSQAAHLELLMHRLGDKDTALTAKEEEIKKLKENAELYLRANVEGAKSLKAVELERDSLRSQGAEAIERLKADHTAQVEKLQKTHNEKLTQLTTLQNEVENLKTGNTEALRKAEHKAKKEREALVNTHNEKIAELNRLKEEAILAAQMKQKLELSQKHDEHVTELRGKHTREKDKISLEKENEIKKAKELRQQEVELQANTHINKIKTEYEEKIAATQKETERQIRDLETQINRAQSDVSVMHTHDELARARAEAETSLKEEMAELKRTHLTEIDDLKRRNTEANTLSTEEARVRVENLKTQQEQELTRLRQDLETARAEKIRLDREISEATIARGTEISDLNANHAQKLKDTQERLESQVSSLKTDLEGAVTRLNEELRTRTNYVTQMTAQLETINNWKHTMMTIFEMSEQESGQATPENLSSKLQAKVKAFNEEVDRRETNAKAREHEYKRIGAELGNHIAQSGDIKHMTHAELEVFLKKFVDTETASQGLIEFQKVKTYQDIMVADIASGNLAKSELAEMRKQVAEQIAYLNQFTYQKLDSATGLPKGDHLPITPKLATQHIAKIRNLTKLRTTLKNTEKASKQKIAELQTNVLSMENIIKEKTEAIEKSSNIEEMIDGLTKFASLETVKKMTMDQAEKRNRLQELMGLDDKSQNVFHLGPAPIENMSEILNIYDTLERVFSEAQKETNPEVLASMKILLKNLVYEQFRKSFLGSGENYRSWEGGEWEWRRVIQPESKMGQLLKSTKDFLGSDSLKQMLLSGLPPAERAEYEEGDVAKRYRNMKSRTPTEEAAHQAELRAAREARRNAGASDPEHEAPHRILEEFIQSKPANSGNSSKKRSRDDHDEYKDDEDEGGGGNSAADQAELLYDSDDDMAQEKPSDTDAERKPPKSYNRPAKTGDYERPTKIRKPFTQESGNTGIEHAKSIKGIIVSDVEESGLTVRGKKELAAFIESNFKGLRKMAGIDTTALTRLSSKKLQMLEQASDKRLKEIDASPNPEVKKWKPILIEWHDKLIESQLQKTAITSSFGRSAQIQMESLRASKKAQKLGKKNRNQFRPTMDLTFVAMDNNNMVST